MDTCVIIYNIEKYNPTLIKIKKYQLTYATGTPAKKKPTFVDDTVHFRARKKAKQDYSRVN